MEQQFLQKHEVLRAKEQKIESARFSFDALRKNVETIPGAEDKEQVMEFVNELERYCQEYIKIEQFYRQAWNKIQGASSQNQEERENGLKELETWMQAKINKKNVIVDDLNILSRLLTNYGLDTSWHHGFASESQFEEWILNRAKKSGN